MLTVVHWLQIYQGKLGIDNYDDMTAAKADVSERMAICLPSIKSMQLQNFVGRIQNLAIDEISKISASHHQKSAKWQGPIRNQFYF